MVLRLVCFSKPWLRLTTLCQSLDTMINRGLVKQGSGSFQSPCFQLHRRTRRERGAHSCNKGLSSFLEKPLWAPQTHCNQVQHNLFYNLPQNASFESNLSREKKPWEYQERPMQTLCIPISTTLVNKTNINSCI